MKEAIEKLLKSTKREGIDDLCKYLDEIGFYTAPASTRFHGAKEGHKIDSITRCDKVSYCVMDEGFRKEGEWALNITSVVVFGRIRSVTDPELMTKIGINLCRKFTDDEEYIKHEVEFALPRAQCLELIPEHMTGKLVNEA